MKCETCGHEKLVPFSCKGRGLCPSCAGRRMVVYGRELPSTEATEADKRS